MSEIATVSTTTFYILAAIIVVSAIYAVTASKLLNVALVLALCFFSIGGLFYLLGAGFLGVLQVLINAGAIPIVTVFIIMMTQSRQSKLKATSVPLYLVGAGLLAVASILFIPKIADYQTKNRQSLIENDLNVQQARYYTQSNQAGAADYEKRAVEQARNNVSQLYIKVNPASAKQIGEKLTSSPETNGQPGGLLAFEIASVVLLVAMVGAIVLAQRQGEVIKGEIKSDIKS